MDVHPIRNWNIFSYPGLNFTYGVETLILYQSLKIPTLSHYKMMVLNLQRIMENDSMILLQNEDCFLSLSFYQNEDWFFILI